MSELSNPSVKRLVWIGHFFFIVFIALAALLYRERVMVADCAFQLFTIIRTKDFAIFHNRFSPFIAQLLPLAAIYAKLPLNAVFVLYSISVPLVCYGYYWLAAHVLKDYRAAIAMALAACIVLTQGFYFAPFELNQAVTLLILLFAFMLQRSTFRWWHWALLLAGIVLALFFHPLIIIGFLFIGSYIFLRAEGKFNWRILYVLGFGIAVIVAKALFFTDAYDNDKLSPGSALKLLPHLFTYPIAANFGRWLLQDYYLVLILAGFITWQYFRTKRWLLLVWFWLALGGYILLVMLAYPQGNDSLRYYLESHYQLIALIVALPFAYDVLPVLKPARIVPLLLLLVLGVRLVTIYAYKTVFTERLAWYDKLYDYTNQFPENRFVLNEKNLPSISQRNGLTWASAYETLFYFTSKHKNPVKTFLISDNPAQFGNLQQEKFKFAAPFEVLDMSDLPAHYFNLVPATYRFLNNKPAENALPGKLDIKPLQKTVYASTNDAFVCIPVRLSSQTSVVSFLEMPNANMLGYHLYKGHQEIAANTYKTPLEVDIQGAYEQMLLVETPKEPGTYEVVPVVLPQVESSWENNEAIELIVK